MFLVSAPERRLLVRSTGEDNHETTLVVPLLPLARVEYEKCLVDAGARFEEHVVVRIGAHLVPPEGRRTIHEALTAARPTIVSFLLVPDGEAPRAESVEGDAVSAPGAAACAVCLIDPTLVEEQQALGFRIVPQRRFYVCEPSGDS